MLNKIMILTLTLLCASNLQAMDSGIKTTTQADAKKEYDAKATAELKQFLHDIIVKWQFPLTISKSKEDAERLKKLLQGNVNVDVWPESNPPTSILCIAAEMNYFNPLFYKILLDSKANPFIPTAEGETVLDILTKYIRRNEQYYEKLPMTTKRIDSIKIIIPLIKEAMQQWAPPAPPTPPHQAPAATASAVETQFEGTAGDTPQTTTNPTSKEPSC